MLVLNNASAGGVGYWQRSAVHSAWLGRGAPLLGLSGAVDGASLRDVLGGRRHGGGPLPARPGSGRRQGWDLVFAAPKSVSLLALSDVEGAAQFRLAYRQALSDAVSTLEDRAAWLRAGGRHVPAEGVVAGAFEHVSNDAGQPHLHTHLVLANIGKLASQGDEAGPVGEGERWGCLVGTELWRWREGIGAGFQMALRCRLGEAGFGFDWDLSAGGLGEIGAVPGHARAAASTRSLALRAGARSFGSASGAAQRAAQASTRRPTPNLASGAGAEAKPALAGLGNEEAAAILRRARARPSLPPPPPWPPSVAKALAERGSSFSEPDVLVALAETSPSGLDWQQACGLSRSWCRASVPSARAGAAPARAGWPPRTWTSPLARQLDTDIVDMVVEARFAHLAEVSPALAWPELGALGIDGPVATAGAHLACSGEGVSVLAPAPWLVQAACIDAARSAWQAAGMQVRVSSPSELSDRRWRALTSLLPVDEPGPGGTGGGDFGTRPPTRLGLPGRRVLVVDAANHISPAALARLVRQASSSRTKLVLIAGGTVPGGGTSLARSFDQLIEGMAPPVPSPSTPARAPAVAPAANAAVSVDGLVVNGCFTGTDAIAHLVSNWRAAAGAERGRARGPSWEAGTAPPLMVTFGPAEAEALNLSARSARRDFDGRPDQLILGERSYALGEEVLALRRIGAVPSATRGTVVAVGPCSLSIEWRGAPGCLTSHVGQEHARSVGYGYATTIPYLRPARSAEPSVRKRQTVYGPGEAALLVLGDPLQLGSRSSLASSAWLAVAGPGMPAIGEGGKSARRRAAVSELATGWPDAQMLERAGPRPLGAAARRRWTEIVTAHALERDVGHALERDIGHALERHLGDALERDLGRDRERDLSLSQDPGHPAANDNSAARPRPRGSVLPGPKHVPSRGIGL